MKEVTQKPKSASRGPRASRGYMKDAILEAAKDEFNKRGYERTTMRKVGQAARCDTALVSYYFGSKQGLFRAAMNLPEDPVEQIIALLKGGWGDAAERLLYHLMDLYETQITAETMHTLLRTLVTDAVTEQRLRAYVSKHLFEAARQELGVGDETIIEIETIMSILFGLVMARYIVRLQPLASMTRKEIADRYVPIIQVFFDRIELIHRHYRR